MRDALNNNPMVQIGVLAGLLVVVALLMVLRMGGGSEAPPEQQAATATGLPPGVSADGTAAPTGVPSATTGSAAGTGAAGATGTPPLGSAPPPPATTVSPEALKPGPGLPAPAADVISSGGTLVLLIVRKSAVDDRMVEDSVRVLSARPGVTVTVVPVDKIARYSRITQSVGVNRTPALVVVRPESTSKTPGAGAGGKSPEATVSYGFRDSKSVIQAVDDAVYDGKDNIPYHPG